MKLLLIRPPAHHCIETEVPSAVRQENVSYPPLSLLAIASYFQGHPEHQVSILDGLLEGLAYPELQRRVAAQAPDVVGITAFTVDLLDVLRTVQAVRAVGVKRVVLGGPHVNDFPLQSAGLTGVDAVVYGEGEAVLPGLLAAWAEGRSPRGLPGVLTPEDATGPAPLQRPILSPRLDDYPQLDLRLIAYDRYYDVLGRGDLFTTVITSRGCPYRCSFCNTPRERYRTMSAGRICAEIGAKLELGVKEIYFVDDTFNIHNDRVLELTDEIQRQGLKFRWTARFRARGVDRRLLQQMKRSGCVRLQIGVEQGTEEGLQALQKDVTLAEIEETFRLCREEGINTVAYFLIGTPTERSRADVLRTIDFSIRLRPDFVMYNVLTPFPGTVLYEQGVARGILRPEPWDRFLQAPKAGFSPQVWDEHFRREELSQLLELAWRRFYFRPGVIWKNLKELSSFQGFARKARAGLSLLLS